MDASSTHLPYLALAVLKFGGPLLEIGCGPFSTPFLHGYPKNLPSFQVVSIERELDWAQGLQGRGFPVHHEPSIANAVERFKTMPWKIVFVDCHKEDRLPSIEAFLNHGCVIVVHDTEADYFVPFLPTVKYVKTFKELCPWTSWMSNVTDVNSL